MEILVGQLVKKYYRMDRKGWIMSWMYCLYSSVLSLLEDMMSVYKSFRKALRIGAFAP